MDQVRFVESAYRIQHRHGDGGWGTMEEQPLHHTNVAFRGLPVSPGRHTIEMRFDPPILKYSAVVSGLAWMLLAGFCWRSSQRVPAA